ncbi:nuclear transport factor 2 family protein [Brevundimonas sp.]|uniref:YybH family protein n=1 Tax=Brevundimonas sp. TaxID=1871086 RepID=UPI001A2F6E91|nr:nuclear transport factor 2 family protein [Brevundimonas sp.]MBJ7483396.1 nuclear transport factor 2 family protein [Brevundimonas sp.]
MIRLFAVLVLFLGAWTLPASSQTAPSLFDEAAERATILDTVATMQAAWNRGDYEGYMQGFKNPDVIFVSGGKIKNGWQGALDDYIRNYGPTPDSRGTLTFYDMTVEFLSPDAAQLIGHYRLERPERPMEGINTRLFRKIDGRWVIALNHVSAYEVAP